ncbi:MAG: hypothetical protein N3B18_11615 [Desulfobacterota bacterium]|nr:hypothetical protein [Thermodesulfobacteriota bacterium]
MHTVRTKEELAKAIVLNHHPLIHVEDKALARALITKDSACRIVYRMAAQCGYSMRVLRCLGVFDVSFYKK